MNTTWTKETPTKPGDYRWREFSTSHRYTLIELFLVNDTLYGFNEQKSWPFSEPADEMGGEWCGPLVPVEEVERAFKEAHAMNAKSGSHQDWLNSRAHKIVEGEIKV